MALGEHELELGVSLQEEQFKAIMGAFNLDPLRVLDVILEAFAQQPKAVIYTKFSLNFTPALIQNNLGFRFQQCKA